MKQKVVFIEGAVTREKRELPGQVELFPDRLTLQGETDTVEFPYDEIRQCEIVSGPGSGTMVRVGTDHRELHVVIPRINFGGRFVIGNVIATRRLAKDLKEHILVHRSQPLQSGGDQ